MKSAQRKKIKNRRRELRLTKAELARISGVSYQTIIGIEKNYSAQRNPQVHILVRLAKALEMDIKELL